MMDGKQWQNQRLYVQDLLRRDLNVGAGVKEREVDKFLQAVEADFNENK